MSADAPLCFRCREPVLPGEEAAQGINEYTPDGVIKHTWHEECAIRSVVGSVGHLRGQCSCRGGTEEDPPGLTVRQAARAAMAEWIMMNWSPARGCARGCP